MRKIAHIVNPVIVNKSSDLFGAQPVTFETMRTARNFARGQVQVAHFSAQYAEDRPLVPDDFQVTPDLERSVLDFGTFQQKRRLPLIKDILDRLYEASDADYLIYTNVDIALMPYFYVAVDRIIEDGYQAFVINRRTISEQYSHLDQLYLMFSQVGVKHPGYDCFVFDRTLYPEYKLGAACIGANWIGRVLITNLICHSKKFKAFEDLHLSFHIGDERSWKASTFQDYDKHNEDELHKILLEYKARGLLQGKPLVKGFLQQIENPPSRSLLRRRRAEAPVQSENRPTTKFNERIDLDTIILSQDPIFVVGFPRSGTTLLQSLLATQEGLYSLPETHYFSTISNAIETDTNDNIERACLNEVFARIKQMMGLEFPRSVANEIACLAEEKKLSYKQFFEMIVFHYLYEQADNCCSTEFRWIEKTPVHFYKLDRILSLYPAAKFVAIVRDPLPTINSHKKLTAQRKESLPVVAFRWNQMTRIIGSFAEQNPDRIRVLRYEDLVGNVEEEMKTLCDFLGIEISLELLKRYQDEGRKLILPWEEWKSDVKAKEIVNTNSLHNISIIDTLIIQHFAQEGMRRYEYRISFPRLQRSFDFFAGSFRNFYGYARKRYVRLLD